jgi:hypothetical protein
MNKGVQFIFAFSVGAAVGAVAAWKYMKARYERIINDEIDAFIEEYTGKKRQYTGPQDADEAAKTVTDEEVNQYESTIISNSYAVREDVEEMNAKKEKHPYVIPPEQYGERDGYDVESLNYYADGVLTDDWDNVIEDVEGVVGKESLEHFGEYEDDSVFVRNERLKTDYEILRDNRTFGSYNQTGKEE